MEDVRAAAVAGGAYRTYQFNYNADPIPHLINITSEIGDGAYFGLTYATGHPLNDPFEGIIYFGPAYRLLTMSVPGAGGLQFAMEYNSGSQELTKVTMPYGGTLEWLYGAKTLAGNRIQREVTYRTLNAADGQGNKTYTIYHDDGADLSRLAHVYTVVVDASGLADKAYFFNTAADFRLGLFSALNERVLPSMASKRFSETAWLQTPNLNPYVSQSDETVDIGQAGIEKKSRVEQTIDDHGNMTLRKQYDFYQPGGAAPLARTFTYAYVTDANYTSRHIRNRLLWVTVQKPGGSLITLATNVYDIYPYQQAPQVSFPSLLRQHDTAAYGTNLIYRGNVSAVTSGGKTLTLTYDYTGNVLATADGYGHSASRVMDPNRNYTVPSSVTGGSLQTSLTWNSYNAPLSATGPNGDVSLSSYDGYARPASRTAANGSVTSFTYSTAFPHWTLATTGTRWTKTWLDGFGRGIKVQSGYGSTTVSIVETTYAPCACTPLGKVWKTSLPYAPGTQPQNVLWTERLYDALGRTLQVKQPNSSGTTTYVYSGIVVTVTDPAGKWKSYENDALGNLAKVTEPRPGGGAPYESFYTYSVLGQLLTVSMTRPGMGTGNGTTVTQTRTWVYDANQRLTSVTHPESGTTSFDYYPDGTLKNKRDQKQQRIFHVYDSDGRVTSKQRFFANGLEDTCGGVVYYYGSQTFDPSFTQNAAGRLAATLTSGACNGPGQFIEMYSYNAAGAVTKKRLRMIRPGGAYVDKDVTYGYGSDGRLYTVLYPGATVPYTYTYDPMDRPVKMTGPSLRAPNTTIDHAKDVVYGTAGQVISMKYLQREIDDSAQGDGSVWAQSYFQETKAYNALYQMTRQTTGGGSGTAADIEYFFAANTNNGRLTGRKNYLSGEDVAYTYDELNRLLTASIAGTQGWGQKFWYDGFGNLREQEVTKGTAPAIQLNVAMLTNRISSANWIYDNNGNTTQMPVLGGGNATLTYDVENRLATYWKSGGTEEYAYLSDNKRVWKKAPDGTETVYFYGAGGQKLGTYAVRDSPFALLGPAVNVYFAGKLIRADGLAVVTDRLGSVVARSDCDICPSVTAKDYFPYGDEIGTATAGNMDKFGTYHRDQTTGLDYADQRYFAGLSGRFLSADPYEASGGTAEPGSWNRYPYVGGDPVNFRDPKGLESEGPADYILCSETGTWMPSSVCDTLRQQSNPTDQHSTCSDGSKVPQGTSCPTTGGGSMTGRTRAHEALTHITANALLGNADCKALLGALAREAGGGATAASIAVALENQAMATYSSWTIYDGPSASTVTLDPAKFGNSASGNIRTVADWFGVSDGRQGLSQQNGDAIFLRSNDWGSYYNPYTSIGGDVNSYGYGTLMHELLHKKSVGGFDHDQMTRALGAVGFTAADNALGKNLQSAGIGSKCF